MSVQSEIARIKGCVSAAYDAVEEKGGTAPSAAQRTAANLAAAVGSIPASASPNLLDNWYFLDPVNQRGRAEYTGAGYTIDRWRINAGSLTVSADGIRLTNGAAIYQRMVGISLNDGKTRTISYMDTDNNVYSGILAAGYQTLGSWQFAYDTGIALYCRPQSNTVGIRAIKLEDGPSQTLARRDASGSWVLNDPPPDYQQELLKCRKYYWQSEMTFASNEKYGTTHLICNVQFPVCMRAVPSCKIVSGGGTEGVLSYWADGSDSGIHAQVNTSRLYRDGFDALVTTEDMAVDIPYLFRVVASAEL